MRLIWLEVAREEVNQKIFIGPLSKIQNVLHYQQHFSSFQSMQ